MPSPYDYWSGSGYARSRADWADFPSTSTPIQQTHLDRIDQAIYDLKFEKFNVRDYGALGDGSTNDSTAIQAAIDAATTNGGEVFFPAGTYRCNITLKAKVRLRGSGRGVTTLKAVASSNTDVVKGLNFATLTGKSFAAGDHLLGAYRSEISQLTVDGDKSTQSAGFGVRLWGAGIKIQDVQIKGCKEDGLWTEYTEASDYTDPVQLIEGYFRNVQIHDCDGHGWTMRGPHDSKCWGLQIWDCQAASKWGLRIETTSGGYHGGIVCYAPNVFLCTNGIYCNGSIDIYGGAADAMSATSGTCLEFAAAVGSNRIIGTIIGGGATGLILRGVNHEVHCNISQTQVGLQIGSSGGGNGAGNNSVRVHGDNNSTAAVYVINESQPNIVHGIFDVPTAAALKHGSSAAWNTESSVDLVGNGAGGSFRDSLNGQITATSTVMAMSGNAAGQTNLGYTGTGDAGLMFRSSGVTYLRAPADARISTNSDFEIETAGKGFRVKEGTNAKMGTAVLVGGTKVVNTTAVTANSRILLTSQADGGTPGFQRVSARTAGTSFTITSSNGADTSTIAWMILEPA